MRLAVNYAIDKRALVDHVLQNTATVAAGPVPRAFGWAYNDKLEPYPYDPERPSSGSPLLRELRRELDLTYLFISHDLAVIEQICTDVVVLKDGRVVERGGREEVFRSPRDEYTRTLIEAAPTLPR